MQLRKLEKPLTEGMRESSKRKGEQKGKIKIKRPFALENAGKLKRFPPETRPPSQSKSNTWPQRVPRRH